MIPLSKPFAMLLAVGLILPQSAVVQACLHGATGLEQTGIMRGSAREEKLVGKWDGHSRSILKLFVGPPGALPLVSTLSAGALKEHADLARQAADIASEGSRDTGVAEYKSKSGINVKVEDVTGSDWSAIAQKYGIKSTGGKKLASLPLWFSKVREEHRALYAVSIDMSAALQDQGAGAEDAYALAVTFQYPERDNTAVIKDKWLEYWDSWEMPIIIRFESGAGVAAQVQRIVAGDPDVNDPKPVPVTLVPKSYGGDGALDVEVKLGNSSYTLAKIRGNAVYFNNGDLIVTPRSAPQSAQNAPPAVPHINMADIQVQAHGL